jgi:hypothetical protein
MHFDGAETNGAGGTSIPLIRLTNTPLVFTQLQIHILTWSKSPPNTPGTCEEPKTLMR